MVLTLTKRLILCLASLLFIGVAQEADAFRFGLNTGFYNEGLKVPCASTREFGLRLGFSVDKTVNDIIYATAIRGINLCNIGGGCAQAPVAPVGCSPVVAAPVGCSPRPVCTSCHTPAVSRVVAAPAVAAAPTPVVTHAPAAAPSTATPIQQIFAYPPGGASNNSSPKSEVYLLMLPSQAQPQQTAFYQPRPAAPQYYNEPVSYVKGLW